MRDICTDVLRILFRRWLIAARTDMGITQEAMARLLVVSLRSYADLESGQSCCSAITLALFLLRVCPDPQAFLEDVRRALENELENANCTTNRGTSK